MSPTPRDEGQAAVLVVGTFLVGLMFLGLVVDLARAFGERAALRSTADAAALSATSALDEQGLGVNVVRLDPAGAEARAQRIARQRGVDRIDVQVHPDRVEVTVHRRLSTVFLRLAGFDHLDVAARASAAPRVARP